MGVFKIASTPLLFHLQPALSIRPLIKCPQVDSTTPEAIGYPSFAGLNNNSNRIYVLLRFVEIQMC
jgi:hypothetical protein